MPPNGEVPRRLFLTCLCFLGGVLFLCKKAFHVFLCPNQFLHLVPCLMVVWVESIEVRLLVPKGILSVRLTGIVLLLVIEVNDKSTHYCNSNEQSKLNPIT